MRKKDSQLTNVIPEQSISFFYLNELCCLWGIKVVKSLPFFSILVVFLFFYHLIVHSPFINSLDHSNVITVVTDLCC